MADSNGGRTGAVTASETVLRDIGGLQVHIGGLIVVPSLGAVRYPEYYSVAAILLAAVVTAPAGGTVSKVCEDAPEPIRHHTMTVVAFGRLVTVAFGALPFLIPAHGTPPGVFEPFRVGGSELPIESL